MGMKKSPLSPIHGLLFLTAKEAHASTERWFLKEKIGVTPLQFGVLRSLPTEGTTLNNLAHRMTFKAPSILPSIDFLEKHGCIDRKNDPHDRRKIHLTITPKGEKIISRVLRSRHGDPLGKAFKKMNRTRQKQLIELLGELQNNLSITT